MPHSGRDSEHPPPTSQAPTKASGPWQRRHRANVELPRVAPIIRHAPSPQELRRISSVPVGGERWPQCESQAPGEGSDGVGSPTAEPQLKQNVPLLSVRLAPLPLDELLAAEHDSYAAFERLGSSVFFDRGPGSAALDPIVTSLVTLPKAYRSFLVAIVYALYGDVARYNDFVAACRRWFIPGEESGGDDLGDGNWSSADDGDGGIVHGGEADRERRRQRREAVRLQQRLRLKTKLQLLRLLDFLCEWNVAVLLVTPSRKDVMLIMGDVGSKAGKARRTRFAMIALEMHSTTEGLLWAPLLLSHHGDSDWQWQSRGNLGALASPASSQDAPHSEALPPITGESENADAPTAVSSSAPSHATAAASVMAMRTTTDEAKAHGYPFYGMRYPNIDQTSLQVLAILRQGLNSHLMVSRVRFLLTFPLSLIVAALAIALVTWLSITMETCCSVIGDTSAQCETPLAMPGPTSDTNSPSTATSVCASTAFCDAAVNPLLWKARSVALFAGPVSVGRCLVVVAAAAAASALATVAVLFFVTRAMALRGARPCFFLLPYMAHIAMGLVATGFAAYVVYLLVPPGSFSVDCTDLDEADEVTCAAIAEEVLNGSCNARVAQQADSPSTALGLAIAILIVSVLQLVGSLGFPLLRAKERDSLPSTTPDTYFFRPNAFAPDGLDAKTTREVQAALRHTLESDLRAQRRNHDMLVTRMANIGDMMEANRAQSLRARRDGRATHDGSLAARNPMGELHYFIDEDESRDAGAEGFDACDPGGPNQRSARLPPSTRDHIEVVSQRVRSELHRGCLQLISVSPLRRQLGAVTLQAGHTRQASPISREHRRISFSDSPGQPHRDESSSKPAFRDPQSQGHATDSPGNGGEDRVPQLLTKIVQRVVLDAMMDPCEDSMEESGPR